MMIGMAGATPCAVFQGCITALVAVPMMKCTKLVVSIVYYLQKAHYTWLATLYCDSEGVIIPFYMGVFSFSYGSIFSIAHGWLFICFCCCCLCSRWVSTFQMCRKKCLCCVFMWLLFLFSTNQFPVICRDFGFHFCIKIQEKMGSSQSISGLQGVITGCLNNY